MRKKQWDGKALQTLKKWMSKNKMEIRTIIEKNFNAKTRKQKRVTGMKEESVKKEGNNQSIKNEQRAQIADKHYRGKRIDNRKCKHKKR